jgi:bacteriophage N4 adsorption protein B
LDILSALGALTRELSLFAAAGYALIGTDDLCVDLLWMLGGRKQHVLADVAAPAFPGKHAVFVAAWQESGVIGSMLRNAVKSWRDADYRIYVGCYPNDIWTIREVQEIDHPRVQLVVGDKFGPTTKGDCLNTLWKQLIQDEAASGQRYKSIIIHDAEDMVHSAELTLFDSVIEQYAMVQLPVRPEIDVTSRWVSGHYIDEFSEAHSRDLAVRQALGASVPMAGVGCAIRRDALERVASARGGIPFDAHSLTEDYELGLFIGELNFPSTFLRVFDAKRGDLIAVRAHFPSSFETAIRQKTRWALGIALLGWRRLGWRGGLAERWMRLRDRRTIISALVVGVGYLALCLSLLLTTFDFVADEHSLDFGPFLIGLSLYNLALLIWRALVRAFCVGHLYGASEAARSFPRMLTSSFIAIASARRAVLLYQKHLKSGSLVWDKTAHTFPQNGAR